MLGLSVRSHFLIPIPKDEVDIVGAPLGEHGLAIEDDGFGAKGETGGGEVVLVVGMGTDVVLCFGDVGFHEGGVVECVTYEHLLEGPEETLGVLCMFVVGTSLFAMVIVAEGE